MATIESCEYVSIQRTRCSYPVDVAIGRVTTVFHQPILVFFAEAITWPCSKITAIVQIDTAVACSSHWVLRVDSCALESKESRPETNKSASTSDRALFPDVVPAKQNHAESK